MNLYKLTLILDQHNGIEWDAMHGTIIAAETPKEAREIANKSTMDETSFDLETGDCYYSTKGDPKHNNIWLKARYTKLQKIGVSVKGIKKGTILEDVHWG